MARVFIRKQDAPVGYRGHEFRVRASHVNELQEALEEDDIRIDQKADISAVHGMIVDEIASDGTVIDAAVSAIADVMDNGLSLESSTNRLDDNKRIRIRTSQKQEPSNNYDGGEVIWYDLENPLAKAMQTWRIRYDPITREVYGEGEAPVDAPYRRVVWTGAHWFAQDQVDDDNPTEIHGHWSIETPDPEGKPRTRFQVYFNDRNDPTKVGSAVALISTNRADFMIERFSTPEGPVAGRFILAGSHSQHRTIEFARETDAAENLRWELGVNGNTESGGNAGGNFILRRHGDNGALLGTTIFVRRETGDITLGSDAWAVGSNAAQVFIPHEGGVRSGIVVSPTSPFAPDAAAFIARHQSSNELALRVRVGNNPSRFEIRSDGRLSWGLGGSGPVDTHLYRDNPNRLRTDGEFSVGSNVRIGGAVAAGGVGVLSIANAATPPGVNPPSGGVIYVEGGVLKYRGQGGTTTTIAPS